MYNKLVLMTTSKKLYLNTTIDLIQLLNDRKLITYIDFFTKEQPCWLFKRSFLYIKYDNSPYTKVYQQPNEIIDYLEKYKNKPLLSTKSKLNYLDPN